jgi:hypothetical protein
MANTKIGTLMGIYAPKMNLNEVIFLVIWLSLIQIWLNEEKPINRLNA